jgi:hypothetical protein
LGAPSQYIATAKKKQSDDTAIIIPHIWEVRRDGHIVLRRTEIVNAWTYLMSWLDNPGAIPSKPEFDVTAYDEEKADELKATSSSTTGTTIEAKSTATFVDNEQWGRGVWTRVIETDIYGEFCIGLTPHDMTRLFLFVGTSVTMYIVHSPLLDDEKKDIQHGKRTITLADLPQVSTTISNTDSIVNLQLVMTSFPCAGVPENVRLLFLINSPPNVLMFLRLDVRDLDMDHWISNKWIYVNSSSSYGYIIEYCSD